MPVHGGTSPHSSEVAGIPDIVHAVKQRLAAMCGPRLVKLCLFGSRAQGEHSPDSDINVAAVIRDLDRREKTALRHPHAGAWPCAGSLTPTWRHRRRYDPHRP